MSDENDIDEPEDSLPNNVVELRPFKRPATLDDLAGHLEEIHERMALVQEAAADAGTRVGQETDRAVQSVRKLGALVKDDRVRIHRLEQQVSDQDRRIAALEKWAKSFGGSGE